jgi:tetratricopeptide (TPR) repeat protein
MNNRAFFSHSSKDKEFGDEVAALLDRGSVIYDRESFEPGTPFGAEIAARLSESGFLVLLGSRDALKSDWVRVELETARSLQQSGLLNESVLFTYNGTTHEDFPAWMRTGRIVPATSPRQVADLIRDHQAELIERNQRPVFLNRSTELAKISTALNSPQLGALRHTIFVYGRTGNGRRSLVLAAFRNATGLHRAYDLNLQSGDYLSDIAIKLAQFSETYTDRSELQLAMKELEIAPQERVVEKVVEYIQVLAANNRLLIINDHGGLLDSNGHISAIASHLLSIIEETPTAYAAVLGRQRPKLDAAPFTSEPIAVDALSTEYAQQLLFRLCERDNIKIDELAARQLATFIGGHGPSLRYAVKQVAVRGLQAVLSNTYDLVSHNIRLYAEDVRTDPKLDFLSRQMLVTLAYHYPLPLAALAETLGIDAWTTATKLEYLLDTVLVIIDSEHRYLLSPPLLEIVTRVYDTVKVNHDAAFESISSYIDSGTIIEDRLSLERARTRAAQYSHKLSNRESFVQLASDMVSTAEQAYRDERYNDALEWSKAAAEARPGNFDANRIYIQSLVKKRKYIEASQHLAEIRTRLPRQEVLYFRGFIARGKGDFAIALRQYQESVLAGRGGLSIERELALCFYRTGRLKEARQHILAARRFPGGIDNPFLIDLDIKIAIARRNEERARKLLQLDRRVDKRHHYLLLSATVNLAFGDPEAALPSLKRLNHVGKGSAYGVLFLQIIAELQLHRYLDAQRHIQEITRFKDEHAKEISALQIAALIARGEAEEALDEIERDDPIARALLLQVAADCLNKPIDDNQIREICFALVNLTVGFASDTAESDLSKD